MKHILAAIAVAALAWPVMAEPAKVVDRDHGMAEVSCPPNFSGIITYNKDRNPPWDCKDFVEARPELSSDLGKAAELCKQYKHQSKWQDVCSEIEDRLLEFVRGVTAGVKP